MQLRRANLIDNGFLVTVLIKGVGGLIELLTGLVLIFISVATLQHLLAPFTHLGIVPTITGGVRLFAILYFSLRGLLRVVLAISLLREQLWAYPVTMLLLGLSVIYQLWLLVSGHFSAGLGGLTLLDAVTLTLTVVEFRKLRRGEHLHLPHPARSSRAETQTRTYSPSPPRSQK